MMILILGRRRIWANNFKGPIWPWNSSLQLYYHWKKLFWLHWTPIDESFKFSLWNLSNENRILSKLKGKNMAKPAQLCWSCIWSWAGQNLWSYRLYIHCQVLLTFWRTYSALGVQNSAQGAFMELHWTKNWPPNRSFMDHW